MPKISDAARVDRRQHILNAAEVCFARDGFHRTTIADVRRQAGVSTGAIYNYFSNKEAIIAAILDQAQYTRLGQLSAAEKSAEGGLSQAFVLLDWVRAIFTEHGLHLARVDANLWAEAVRDPRVAKIAGQALSGAMQAVRSVVDQRLEGFGTCTPTVPRTVSSILVSMFLGIEILTLVGIPLDPDEVVTVLTALFALPREADAAPRQGPARTRAVRRPRTPRNAG
jgi:TetR/AcrR family transcriptional repressor of uid operon